MAIPEETLVQVLRNLLAFGRRGIPARCVARRSNTPDIRPPRALPAGRRAPENLSPNFGLGTLAAEFRGPDDPAEYLDRQRSDLPQERIDACLQARQADAVRGRTIFKGLAGSKIPVAPAALQLHRTQPSPGRVLEKRQTPAGPWSRDGAPWSFSDLGQSKTERVERAESAEEVAVQGRSRRSPEFTRGKLSSSINERPLLVKRNRHIRARIAK